MLYPFIIRINIRLCFYKKKEYLNLLKKISLDINIITLYKL